MHDFCEKCSSWQPKARLYLGIAIFLVFQIPIYKGSEKSLTGSRADSSDYHGRDGLGDVCHPEPVNEDLIKREHAVSAMISMASKYKGTRAHCFERLHCVCVDFEIERVVDFVACSALLPPHFVATSSRKFSVFNSMQVNSHWLPWAHLQMLRLLFDLIRRSAKN